jgi:hypothetical protein
LSAVRLACGEAAVDGRVTGSLLFPDAMLVVVWWAALYMVMRAMMIIMNSSHGAWLRLSLYHRLR